MGMAFLLLVVLFTLSYLTYALIWPEKF